MLPKHLQLIVSATQLLIFFARVARLSQVRSAAHAWQQVLEETIGINRFQLIAKGQIRVAFRKTVRATRAVSSGTCAPGCGHRDTALSPQIMVVKMALILPGFPEKGNSPTVSKTVELSRGRI